MIGIKESVIDLDKLKAIYKLGRNLSFSDIQGLLKAAERRSYEPKEYLFEAGSTTKEMFFIQKGLVRCFKVNDKGEEITTMLHWENQFFSNPDIILFDQPSQAYYETLEPTVVYCLNFDLLQTIIAENPKLEKNRVNVFRNVLKRAMVRMDSFVMLSPEERYLEFVQRNPDIVNRVPNKYIANVLGITPVSLSRIRKRIASRKK